MNLKHALALAKTEVTTGGKRYPKTHKFTKSDEQLEWEPVYDEPTPPVADEDCGCDGKQK